MGSRIKRIGAYNGCTIYQSANTHPFAKTRALIIFTHCEKSSGLRARYEVGNAKSYKKAYSKLAQAIDKYHKLTKYLNPPLYHDSTRS